MLAQGCQQWRDPAQPFEPAARLLHFSDLSPGCFQRLAGGIDLLTRLQPIAGADRGQVQVGSGLFIIVASLEVFAAAGSTRRPERVGLLLQAGMDLAETADASRGLEQNAADIVGGA